MSQLRGWVTTPRVRRWAQVAVMVALFSTAGIYIAGRRDEFDVIRNVSIGYGAVLTLLGAVTLVWNGLFLRHLLRVFDVRLSVFESTAISVFSTIINYVLPVVGGAGAFAVGFAMRDLVAAVIAGVTIMFDTPFQVGDRVQYAGQYGDIIQIGLRSVRMRTLDDNIVTIPNNKILTDVTSSGN